jgi:hypothetical protein
MTYHSTPTTDALCEPEDTSRPQAALECLFLVTCSLDRPNAARHAALRDVTVGRVDPFLTAMVTRHAQVG